MKISDNKIHFIFQPQPGIGKKYIAFLLEQYLSQKRNARSFMIQEKNIIFWDSLFNKFFTQAKQVFIVVVNSHCFLDFEKYLKESQVLNTIPDPQNKIYNHYVFTPGRNGERVIETLEYILSSIQERAGKNIIWENDNLGTTLNEFSKGRFSRLFEMPEFKKIEKKVSANIYLPAETLYFQKNLSSHICSGETFKQAISNSANDLIYRQRIYQLKKRTFKDIENANI